MKDFYSIRDFYNQLSNPDRVPTAHRHFQVYLYPQIATGSGDGTLNLDIKNFHNVMMESNVTLQNSTKERGYSANQFFTKWQKGDTLEQFSLAIQEITLPVKFNVKTTQFESPFGIYNGVDNDDFYGKMEDNTLTFTLIDQMNPLFEKKFNDWIFEINRCHNDNRVGYPIPKVNIAIKYFRQDQVSKESYSGRTIQPNFIYYFTDAFPIEFQTCSISHANDSDADFKRQVIFKFNNMYPLHNEEHAQRFNLRYLFTGIHIN